MIFLINMKALNRLLKFVGLRVWVLKTYNGKAVNMAADIAHGETYAGLAWRLTKEPAAKVKAEERVAAQVLRNLCEACLQSPCRCGEL